MDEAGKFTHLFDPRTGGSQPRYKSMSVMAESAAVADAFSTAFSIMDEAAIRAAAQVKKAQVWLVMPNNELKKIGRLRGRGGLACDFDYVYRAGKA